FDSVAVLRGNFFAQWIEARRFVRARRDFQCWVVPCTNEPYSGLKFLAMLLPLARRRIYNELADGFAAREPGTLYAHCLWRLRDRLSFQIVAGAAGSNRIARAGHLVLYAARLLAGAALLARTLLRPRRFRRGPLTAPRVDLLVLGAAEDGPDAADPVSPAALVRVVRITRNGSLGEVNAAIQASDAEFICLLDRECRMSPSDWIERLLESFDDRTAQVGPQLSSPDGETLLRGLLLEGRGALAWNLDNAVQWRRRLECLEVDALPWPCVLIRRRIFSEVGYFAEDSGTMETWADARFSGRLAARGWRSVCNRSVTATHPAAEVRFRGLRAALREVTEELRR
ncbi:MAG: glycosyltransferase family 2 protein, partial [Terriglobia bacterium]